MKRSKKPVTIYRVLSELTVDGERMYVPFMTFFSKEDAIQLLVNLTGEENIDLRNIFFHNAKNDKWFKFEDERVF